MENGGYSHIDVRIVTFLIILMMIYLRESTVTVGWDRKCAVF